MRCGSHTHSNTHTHSCDCVTMKGKKVGQKETGKKGLDDAQTVRAGAGVHIMSCHVMFPVCLCLMSLFAVSVFPLSHISSHARAKLIPAHTLPVCPALHYPIQLSFFFFFHVSSFFFAINFPGMCAHIVNSDLHL